MGQLPTDRTISNTPAEHVADHNELHRLHDVVDGVSLLEATDGDPVPLAVLESKIGIDMDGNPYFDADGAVSGEEAALLIDPYTGALLVSKPNPAAGSHDVDSGAHPSILARLAALESGASPPGVRQSFDFLITEEATDGSLAYPITAVSIGDSTFTIAGDHTTDLDPCTWISVKGSTGNDGTYGITASVFSAGHTVLTVDVPPSDATVDGDVKPPGYQHSLLVPARSVVQRVVAFPFANWAADGAALYVADDHGSYIEGQDLLSFGPYDPLSVAGTFADSSQPINSASNATYVNAMAEHRTQAGVAFTGPGVRYAVDTNIKIQVVAVDAAPVSPTGSLLVKVEYLTAATEVAVGLT